MGDLRPFLRLEAGVSVYLMTKMTVHKWPRGRGAHGWSAHGDRARRVLAQVQLATGASALLCRGAPRWSP
jgi:hypothetical protein